MEIPMIAYLVVSTIMFFAGVYGFVTPSILENLAVIDGKPKDTLIKQVEILWVTVTDKFKRKVDGTER